MDVFILSMAFLFYLVGLGGSACPLNAQDTAASENPANRPALRLAAPLASTPALLCFEKSFQTGPACGPNALYLLLRLCERQVTYEQVRAQVALGPTGASIESLKTAANHFGLITQIRKIAPEDLRNLPTPLIVHLDTVAKAGTPNTAEGHFALITQITEEGALRGIDTTNGGETSWNARFFARNTSGYVLVLASPSRAWLNTPLGFTLSGSLFVLLWTNVILLRGYIKRRHD